MATPVCGYDCILVLTSEDPCNLQTKCLCTSTNYLNGFHSCINEFCDATGIQEWIQYGVSNCAAVGVSFSVSGATATQAAGATSTSELFQTSAVTAVGGHPTAVTDGGFPFATTVVASASVIGLQPFSSTTPSPAQTSQGSTSGLGVGAIVGIAIGAVALVLIAILVAFLIWRKRRNQPRQPPPEIARAPVVEPNGPRPDMQKQFQPVTTINAVYNPELSADQAVYAANYEGKQYVPDIKGDPRYPSQQLNPVQAESLQHLSPVSANTELAAAVPSEAAHSIRAPSDYGPPYHNAVEADSTRQSYMTSPVSEISSNPYDRQAYERQQELSATPYVTPHEPIPGHSFAAAHELSSSPAAIPATLPIAHASASTPLEGPSADNGEDAELDRMKAEIEAVRAEKEHVLHLKALEERERELSRKIVNRELSRGGGS